MSERSLHSLSHLLSNLRSDDGDKGTEEATDVAIKMREEYNAAMCVCRIRNLSPIMRFIAARS